MSLETPILFLIFNRPDTTQRVFNEIKKAKPSKLYVAADGPRENKEGERELCIKTRNIIGQIDWKCDVIKLFRDENVGCKIAVSSAIDWFFENEEQGIILEDDCLPHESFFPFCEEMLKFYKNDERVSMISGDNFQFGWKNTDDSYYFSKYCHIWGWATWRRAWNEYDVEISDLPEFIEQNKIANIFNDKKLQKYWLKILKNVYNGKINTWDYQWSYSIWKQDGLCVLPNMNLISNIGCGSGTHVSNGGDKSDVANMPTYEIEFPLIHPKSIERNNVADLRFRDRLLNFSIFNNIILIIKKCIKMN